jgi:hypothetical protein
LKELCRPLDRLSTWPVELHHTKPTDFPFPSSPLAEQQAIVARVNSLMATIDALETQVSERKEQAQLLMQAVLREAFAGGIDGNLSRSLQVQRNAPFVPI